MISQKRSFGSHCFALHPIVGRHVGLGQHKRILCVIFRLCLIMNFWMRHHTIDYLTTPLWEERGRNPQIWQDYPNHICHSAWAPCRTVMNTMYCQIQLFIFWRQGKCCEIFYHISLIYNLLSNKYLHGPKWKKKIHLQFSLFKLWINSL